MANITQLPIVKVLINEIVVGERRRQKLGKLQSLQRSIQAHGLIHPILLRNGMELVAGARRLEACRRLEWKTIAARHVDGLSDEDLRAIEFDENAERESLNDYEASKARLAEIRQAEAKKRATRAISFQPETKTPRTHRKTGAPKGRPKQAGSKRDVAKETGISPSTQVRLERHVELAEEFPFMQRPGWAMQNVLAAGEQLEKLPPTAQQAAAVLLDQPAIPPKTAVEILENLSEMPSPQRQEIFKLAKSDDSMERRTALTMAAKLPPPPDPGLTRLGNAVHELQLGAKQCRNEMFRPKLIALAEQARELDEAFTENEKEKRNGKVIR